MRVFLDLTYCPCDLSGSFFFSFSFLWFAASSESHLCNPDRISFRFWHINEPQLLIYSVFYLASSGGAEFPSMIRLGCKVSAVTAGCCVLVMDIHCINSSPNNHLLKVVPLSRICSFFLFFLSFFEIL